MGKAKKAAKAAGKADRDATHRVARARDHPVVKALGGVSEVADQPPLVALSLATIALGAVSRRPAVVRSGVRMVAAHALATGVKAVLKTAIDRTRPAEAIRRGKHAVGKGTGTTRSELNSFPSGHTAGAVAVAQAVAHDAPGAALPVRLAAGGIGAMQVPRGTHYLSDVVVGVAIGWLAERITSAALDAAERSLARVRSNRARADAEAEAEAHPS